MRKILSGEAFLLLSRVILGLVFVIASIEKIAIPELFASSIQAYAIMPVAIINILALWLPWIELVCGILLLSGVAVRGSAFLISGMLAVFIVALLSAVLRGLDIDCGCFGGMSQTPVGWNKILENTGLLLLGIQLMLFPPRKFVLQKPPTEAEA